MQKIAPYKIQQWLFTEAEGNFQIDLGESGIQYNCFHDLDLSENYGLNYSLDHGNLNLRSIIASLYQVKVDQVMITHGSQEALYLFYRSLLSQGDHVITFSPGWQQSWEVPEYIGANVTILPLKKESNYSVIIEDVKNAITDKTKLIILNSPHNPTGYKIENKIIEELIKLCKTKNIQIINDEEYLTNYGESIVNKSPYCSAVSSLSKVYGFPGLRLGWFVGGGDIVKDMVNYRRYTTVCNSYLCEQLAGQVLLEKAKYINTYQELVENGLLELKNWIKKHPQLNLIEPQGTPFAYIVFPDSIDTNKFSKHLMYTHKVLVMPAEVFEDQFAIRISFGRPLEILKPGLDRISKALNEYL
jgi:aspartate/methionine/tyrosine aminotransferase